MIDPFVNQNLDDIDIDGDTQSLQQGDHDTLHMDDRDYIRDIVEQIGFEDDPEEGSIRARLAGHDEIIVSNADAVESLSNDISAVSDATTVVQTQVNVGHNSDGTHKDGSVPFSATEGIWWEEVGRATLSSSGDTITVNPIASKKFLQIRFSLLPTGGAIDGSLILNNDSGSNYAFRYATNGASDSTVNSSIGISINPDQAATPRIGVFDVVNIATYEKILTGIGVSQGTAGAATSPSRREIFAKWANTSDQITRIDINNVGAGSFAAGSEVVVLGHD